MTNFLLYLGVVAVTCFALPLLMALMAWVLTGRPPAAFAGLARSVEGRFRRSASTPVPDVLLELELARLARAVQQARDTPRPGQALHVRASTAAYDHVLLSCCGRVGLTAPTTTPPLSDRERFEVETRLMEAGVTW